jgi:hypothetical protein
MILLALIVAILAGILIWSAVSGPVPRFPPDDRDRDLRRRHF